MRSTIVRLRGGSRAFWLIWPRAAKLPFTRYGVSLGRWSCSWIYRSTCVLTVLACRSSYDLACDGSESPIASSLNPKHVTNCQPSVLRCFVFPFYHDYPCLLRELTTCLLWSKIPDRHTTRFCYSQSLLTEFTYLDDLRFADQVCCALISMCWLLIGPSADRNHPVRRGSNLMSSLGRSAPVPSGDLHLASCVAERRHP